MCMYNMERKGDKMSYKVTVSDGTVLENCIQDVQFYIDTSSDYIFTSKHINKNTILITGYIDTDESTISLYNWALLPATNPDCYKEIIIEQYKSEKLLRKVTFSKAFVVKYSESHSYDKGVGTFTLYIKQLYGQDIEVTSEDASPSAKAVPSPALEIEEETQNQNSEPEKKKEEKEHITKVGRRKALKPNTEYEVNGYKYQTDEKGRIIICEGTLKLEDGERNAYDQKIVGREDKKKTDDGGHLVATIFGGSGDIDNLVPMDSNLNRGEWRKLENIWRDALEAEPPQEVHVTIMPVYEDDSQRPTAFDIEYQIGNGKVEYKEFKNRPGGN